MTFKSPKVYLPEKYWKLEKFKSLLIRSGNKERTNTFILHLFQLLKLAAHVNKSKALPITLNQPLHTLGEKKPLVIINKCLYELMPAFILRKIFVAGKYLELPVPISGNRASFMAADWLRKASFKDTKNALSVPLLITREIVATLHHNGAALDYLKAYVDIALDQRPFSRYIRKKRKNKVKSKQRHASRKAYKLFRRTRNRVRKERARTKQTLRRIHRRNIQKKRSKISLQKRQSIKTRTNERKHIYNRSRIK